MDATARSGNTVSNDSALVEPGRLFSLEREMAREGDIAFCGQRQLGLITKAKGNPMSGMMYYGIHLNHDKLGDPWQSKSPQVIGNLHDILTSANAEKEENCTSN